MNETSKKYLNPYFGGVLLGILLLISYGVLGTGLGASGGLARIAAGLEGMVAERHVIDSAYFGQWGESPMRYYLVFMLGGIILGGGLSAVISNRFRTGIEKGSAASSKRRLLFALGGGVLVGIASRLARGCTSGQALSGGALLLTGSLLFVFFLFLSGFLTARFFKEQWND